MHIVEVNCKRSGYSREQWIKRWRLMIEHFFNVNPGYDWNGPVVLWFFQDKEIAEEMTTIWSLQKNEYRSSFQPTTKTFYWVDSNFYRQNKVEILKWCELYSCEVSNRQYGWIRMPNEKVELLFRLQWAGKCYDHNIKETF